MEKQRYYIKLERRQVGFVETTKEAYEAFKEFGGKVKIEKKAVKED